MTRLDRHYLLGILGLLALLLSGCSLPGTDKAAGDIDQFAPPSVAAAAAQSSGTVIRIQPATQQLNNVGDLGNLQIWVDNVTNLFGAEISVQYDPQIIQAQDADPAIEGVQIQPGNFLVPDFVPAKQADNTIGFIFYTVTQTAPHPPVTGSGVLATITFKAMAQGASNLTFVTVKLSDANGQPIQATIQTGQVTVGQGTGQPTATFTPTFTPIPGQPTPTFTPLPGQPTPTFTPIPPSPTPIPPPPTITPIPPAMNIPPGATVGFCYRVQAGETLASIGQKFGMDSGYLNLVNDLNPPGYVFLHQALFIPEQRGQGPNVYIVKAGDTLVSIADQCHLPASFLAFANKLNENAVIQAGHVLEIPIPPFAPPSRYSYPPPGPPPVFPPPCCNENW